MKTKLLWCFLVVGMLTYGQRTCGTVHKMEQLQFNPLMKQLYDQQKLVSEQAYQNALDGKNNQQILNTIKIPVAVHYVLETNATETKKNCLRSLAQNQVDILNADYKGLNVEISTTWNVLKPTNYPAINHGSMNVEFVIADQNHPSGSGLINGQKAITFGYNFGNGTDFDSTWAGYLNLVVDNLGSQTLGYAYLGSNPGWGAAVFINTFCFGSGSGCSGYAPTFPFNKGRTLTHELGHYMNLNHIWGDALCGNDLVADTPVHHEENYGCPSINTFSTCTGTPRMLHMNYMDYTDDACLYMFTAGQVTRMQSHLNNIVNNFNQTVLSNQSFEQSFDVVVYPNPSNGIFTVEVPTAIQVKKVLVFDALGREVLTLNNGNLSSQLQINLPNKGIYYASFETETGVIVKKLAVN
ncbi:MAG: zinc-dependent metalloprotease [Flavobacterium sp.]